MKITTILGTRPEIIRLSRIMPLLDKLCKHTIIHTTQNHDYRLNDIFFKELGLRLPDIFLGAKEMSLGEQLAIMFPKLENIFSRNRPDKVVILGDTNSGLASFMAERMGIPVYHLEAGNRCHDKRVPEEVNRKLIDAISSYNLPYTPGSRENLIREGVSKDKIFTSGNPINEVLNYYSGEIQASRILKQLKLQKQKYFLATFHRAETVDYPDRLNQIVEGLLAVAETYGIPIVCSIHPRTRKKLTALKYDGSKLMMLEPFGFFDFVKLEKNAMGILTDSGTVSEEACILGVPCIVMRDTTERPEIVESGSAIVSTVNSARILACTEIIMHTDAWPLPIGYGDLNVATKIINFVIGGEPAQ